MKDARSQTQANLARIGAVLGKDIAFFLAPLDVAAIVAAAAADLREDPEFAGLVLAYHAADPAGRRAIAAAVRSIAAAMAPGIDRGVPTA